MAARTQLKDFLEMLRNSTWIDCDVEIRWCEPAYQNDDFIYRGTVPKAEDLGCDDGGASWGEYHVLLITTSEDGKAILIAVES